ncbi:predicted protein [Naegleria gruberi]|uniref:Predicted protein n=1 Tax=Naegleria gruberi TaxID=5762 RepID=D2VK09_NAEGR|nr:uncharacterized protein NAEGRDRAFT_50186 [Naegleria gruberi]EFC42866.1 predicted protein [Naegleria gruberi]|eukprot:XP_002675610.1 predicted protein [Naegleria gruberi strain NEG-M]
MEHSDSPIFSMCKTGDLHGVKNLLTNDQTRQLLHAKDAHGNSLLYYASLCGRISLVKYLSELGLRDDEYRRCWWNALSLQTRSVLKLFNDYKNIPSTSSGMNTESNVLSVMHKLLMKCLHNDLNNSSSDQLLRESNSGEDMILRFKFKDQNQPTEFKCQSWIILSRWPQIVLFALKKVQLEKVINLPTLDKHEMNLCKLSAQDFENYVKRNNTNVIQQRLTRIITQEKNKLKELKSRYSMILGIPNLDMCNQALAKENFEMAQTNLKCIDFGSINANKEHFELALTYLYTTKIPPISDKYDIYCLMELGVMLNMKSMVDHIFNMLREANDNQQEDVLLNDLDPINYLFKDCKSKIDSLKKTSCNMGLKMVNSTDGKILLCHKSIAMSRCAFFDVLGNCDFEDGLKFKQQEATHELPVMELQQFSLESTLQTLLRYIYCEKAEITKSNAVELMHISDLYGLSSLSDKCEQFLCENTTSRDGNLFELYKLSIEMERKKWQRSLEPKALEFIEEQTRRQKINQAEIVRDLEDLDLNPDTIKKFKNASNSAN